MPILGCLEREGSYHYHFGGSFSVHYDTMALCRCMVYTWALKGYPFCGCLCHNMKAPDLWKFLYHSLGFCIYRKATWSLKGSYQDLSSVLTLNLISNKYYVAASLNSEGPAFV